MKWIQELQRKTELNKILTVEYNSNHDITALVKQKEKESDINLE